ncbi:MAG: hypothetical protein GY926_01420, partial [bacterium]|nr:hypothetical protein [bacterium]
ATGNASDLTPAEHSKLDRVLHTNPWLWQGAGLLSILKDSMLEGGTMVYGRPAFRIALKGEGDRELFLFEDGTAAGCQYIDPVQEALIELRQVGDHCLIIKDGELKPGWSISAPRFQAPASTLFERPTR